MENIGPSEPRGEIKKESLCPLDSALIESIMGFQTVSKLPLELPTKVKLRFANISQSQRWPL